MGVPLNHPFVDRCFIMKHPFRGTPFMETPISSRMFLMIFFEDLYIYV